MNVTLKNALALLFSQVGTIFMSSVLLVFVPTYFGEDTFGRYTYAAVYTGFFGLVGAAGTGTYLVKTIARDRSHMGSYAVNGVVLKVVIGLVLSGLAMGIGRLMGLDRNTVLFVAAALIVMVLTMVNEILVSCLHGVEQMSRPAKWGAIGQVLAGMSTLGLIALGLAPSTIVFLAVPFTLVPIVANALVIRAQTAPIRSFRIRPVIWKTLAIGGFPFMLYQIVLYAYGSVDLLMLRPMTDSSTVGWYSLAYRIISLPVLLAATVLLAMFPSLSVQGVRDPERLASQVNRALRFICFITFPLAIGTIAIASRLIETFYSSDFDQAAVLIRILALSMPVVVVDLVLGMALFATDRQSSFLIVGLIAAILNPALNFIAIPYTADRYSNGAIGAASVTVLTEVVIMFGALRLRPAGVLDRSTMSYVARCAIAAALVLPAALLLDVGGLATMVIAGGAIYLVATKVLGVVPGEELTHLLSQVRRRDPATVVGDMPLGGDPDSGTAASKRSDVVRGALTEQQGSTLPNESDPPS